MPQELEPGTGLPVGHSLGPPQGQVQRMESGDLRLYLLDLLLA
jgi:hypothetical protein